MTALRITKEEHAPTCTLSLWQVADEANFVDVLAWPYLRKPAHAAKIIDDLDPGPSAFPGRVFENAIDLLRYDTSNIDADLASADAKVAVAAQKIRDTRGRVAVPRQK